MVTRWWQLKYFLFSPQSLGKIPLLTTIDYMFQLGWELKPPTRLLTIYSVVYNFNICTKGRKKIPGNGPKFWHYVKLQAPLINVSRWRRLLILLRQNWNLNILSMPKSSGQKSCMIIHYFECSGHFGAYLLDFIYLISHFVVEDSIEMERFLSLQIADHPGQFGSLSQELQKQQLSQRALEDVRSACTPWNVLWIYKYCLFLHPGDLGQIWQVAVICSDAPAENWTYEHDSLDLESAVTH